jgi:hypothetical protein
MPSLLPTPPITLGCMKNEVVECKHYEVKNLKTTQGTGRGGPLPEIRGINVLILILLF